MSIASQFKVVDTHMHVIPGVDDGALDQSMSLMMLYIAQKQGIHTVFATPHSGAFRISPETPKEAFSRLCEAAAEQMPEVQLYLGCEIICEPVYMERVVQALQSGLFPTMNGTRFALVEFTTGERAEGISYCIEELLRNGYRPILAHTERYIHLQNDIKIVDQFREMGAKIQVNAFSLAGEKDSAILEWARSLVKMQRADYLGTDAHRTYHRPPDVKEGLQWLYQNSDSEYAEALAWGNARRDLLCTKEAEHSK